MALFPQIGPEYYSEEDRDIKSRMESFYREAISINQSFWAEADIDTRFEAGDQSIWNDKYGNYPANRHRKFFFNRMRRVKNMISGHQRRNRKSTVVVPVDNGDQQTADQFSKIISHVHRSEGVLETISNSFEGALITGLNFLQLWVDYRSDPVSGDIKVDNCSYNSFLVDPYFKKQDLSDCNGLWKRSFLSKKECASLIPDHKDEIMKLSCSQSKDGKFQYMPESHNYSMKNLLAYDEFYYKDYRTQRILTDTQTGETMEWSGPEDALKEYLRIYPQVKISDHEISTVNLAVIVNGKVFYNGPNPIGIDNYPFIPVLAYFSPEMPYYEWRIQGIIRGLRDAQYLYNRRKTIELDILESQINSGWKYKANALINPKDIFLSGQGRGLALKSTAQMTDVERIMPPQIPPSMMQLSESLGREIQEISGVNEELLGSALDDKAGILSMLRQGAGLTTLQKLFDQLDYSQKLLGKLMIKVIQSNFAPGKVKRIIEDEPAPQFYNKAFGKYDAAIEEGLNTSTQRQMQFVQLVKLREIGIPVPDDVMLEAASVQNKQELTDAIKAENEKKAQIEQMQNEIAMQEQQARAELSKARAIADKGLGLERISRIKENDALAVERRASAVADQEKALLDKVKALKEIEDLDLAQLERLIRLSKLIKEKDMGAVEEEAPVSMKARLGS